MADKVSKAQYAYVMVPDRKGKGASALGALKKAGVNMLAFSGFPAGKGRAQLTIVPERMAELRRVARRAGWKLSAVKRCFLVTGKDRVGAVESQLARLAKGGVSVTASTAMSYGKGSWAMIVWVKPQSYAKAAKALHAR